MCVHACVCERECVGVSMSLCSSRGQRITFGSLRSKLLCPLSHLAGFKRSTFVSEGISWCWFHWVWRLFMRAHVDWTRVLYLFTLYLGSQTPDVPARILLYYSGLTPVPFTTAIKKIILRFALIKLYGLNPFIILHLKLGVLQCSTRCVAIPTSGCKP